MLVAAYRANGNLSILFQYERRLSAEAPWASKYLWSSCGLRGSSVSLSANEIWRSWSSGCSRTLRDR